MTSSTATPRPSRPLGVWVLSACALLFEGLFPAFAMAVFIIAALRTQLDTSGTALSYLLVVRMLINLGAMIAAILAFLGIRLGRWSLLVLVTLNHVLAIQNLPLLIVGPLPQEALPGLIEGAIKHAVVPAVYIWYFTRRRVRQFYGAMSTPVTLSPAI